MLENNPTIHLTLNGESRAFTVEPQETLLHVLRERAHLTGAKKGCDLGECGVCTVIMDGRAVNSCCVFAIEEYDPYYPQESQSVCNSRKPPSLLDLSNGACSVMCPSVFRE